MSEIHQRTGMSANGMRLCVSVFLKLVSLALIFFSIGYWTRLTGVIDASVSFETLPAHWKIAGSALVTLMPIAALGLWGNARWGLVIWFLVLVMELVMYGWYPDLFGERRGAVIFHLVTLFTYVALVMIATLVEYRQAREART